MTPIEQLSRARNHRRLSLPSDAVLALVVLGVVALLILPLPTPIMDGLIALNLTASVLLLLLALHVNDALRFAAFPSLLLITTLFRLGLNVASTRLILMQADAGQVIASFGGFVVGGSLVVGAVIFLILTVVQYLVIARGSERVAEVAARFTLDALPGKQLAVDADLRAGLVDQPEARRLRRKVQREAQLYGAMDGAMKFVKGDAICGMVITAVNIVGGLSVGVLQRGLDPAEAARIYTQLTVGDGLVSQIPALLISLAAGIVVTRVASEDEAHLGDDMVRQVSANPRAVAMCAVLMLLLAVVPGLPLAPFLFLAGCSGLLAWTLYRRQLTRFPTETRGRELDGPEAEPDAAVILELGPGLERLADPTSTEGALLRRLLDGVGQFLDEDLGLRRPSARVRPAGSRLAVGQYRVLLFDVPRAQGIAQGPSRIVVASLEQLRALGVKPLAQAQVPGLTEPAWEVLPVQEEPLRRAGLRLLDPATQICLHLLRVLRRRADSLLGLDDVQRLLEQVGLHRPALLREVVPRRLTLQRLTRLLRDLLGEQVPIRPLHRILEIVADLPEPLPPQPELLERVRAALAPVISRRWANPDGTLPALLLHPMIEGVLEESLRPSEQGQRLVLEPDLLRDFLASVRQALDEAAGHQAVLVTRPSLRRPLGILLKNEIPDMPVLGFGERDPELQLQPLARVNLR